MASKQRLIDANALFDELLKKQFNEQTMGIVASYYPQMRAIVAKQPTVDAVVLPCEVGTQVWLIKWWCGSTMNWEKQKEPLPRNVHHFEIAKSGVFAHFRDGCINVKYFGEIVFFTKEEAEAALAKMDGGNEDG